MVLEAESTRSGSHLWPGPLCIAYQCWKCHMVGACAAVPIGHLFRRRESNSPLSNDWPHPVREELTVVRWFNTFMKAQAHNITDSAKFCPSRPGDLVGEEERLLLNERQREAKSERQGTRKTAWAREWETKSQRDRESERPRDREWAMEAGTF